MEFFSVCYRKTFNQNVFNVLWGEIPFAIIFMLQFFFSTHIKIWIWIQKKKNIRVLHIIQGDYEEVIIKNFPSSFISIRRLNSRFSIPLNSMVKGNKTFRSLKVSLLCEEWEGKGERKRKVFKWKE